MNSILVSAATLAELGGDFSSMLCNIICVIWYVIAGIASLVLLVSGVEYLAGDISQRNEAKINIVYAIAGLVVIVIAPYLANYLTGGLGILPFTCDCLPTPPYGVSCPECYVGSCNCTTNCDLGTLEIYYSDGCGGPPDNDPAFSGGKVEWPPPHEGTYHVRVYCDDGKRTDCAEVKVVS